MKAAIMTLALSDNYGLAKALSLNHYKPCKPNPRRAEFRQDYQTHGYDYVCAKYASDSLNGRILYGGKKRLRALLVKLKLKPM